MNNKLLLNVITDLHKLAESLQAYADEPEISQPEPTIVQMPETKKVTLEQVRAVLADKSRSGKTDKVRNLLKSFGADKLSEIDASRYAEILKAGKEL